MSDDETTLIPRLPMPDADGALREAVDNIRAAERFFNHGMPEKSYNAAYIAGQWLGISNSLHIREQMKFWQDIPAPVPAVAEVPKEEPQL